MNVIKRDDRTEKYDNNKVALAVSKAMTGAGQKVDPNLADLVAANVTYKLLNDKVDEVPVEHIHKTVEDSLMFMGLFDLAREYITYRSQNLPDIFRKRVNIKPVEYPQLLQYVDGIRHSYWVHTKFNYDSDVQDLKVNMEPYQVTIATRAMLAISQIESAVKTFWGSIHNILPKPEVAKVGATNAESEVRHEDAYSELLQIAGLNYEFQKLNENPAIRKRISYLEKVNAIDATSSRREALKKIMVFSILIEAVSLFSQFLIITSFYRNHNMLKGMSNAVSATSKEENLHFLFGAELSRIIMNENPDLIDDDFYKELDDLFEQAILAEKKVIEWIFSVDTRATISLDFTNARNYTLYRLDKAIKEMHLDYDHLPKTRELVLDLNELTDDYKQSGFLWFEDEINLTKNADFFNTRSTDYSKQTKSFSVEDLF